METAWKLLYSNAFTFKKAHDREIIARLLPPGQISSPETRANERAARYYSKLEIDFEPTLNLPKESFEKIQYDQSLQLKAASTFKRLDDLLVDKIVASCKEFSKRKGGYHELAKDITEALVETEGIMMDAAERLLGETDSQWQAAKAFHNQRRNNLLKSVARVGAGVFGALLGTTSAIASGGASILGAVLAWYACLRTAIAAIDETNQAFKGIYILMREADAMLMREYDRTRFGAAYSGMVRGFVGASTVDTLQRVMGVVLQVESKLPYYKVSETKLAKRIVELLDKQQELEAKLKEASAALARLYADYHRDPLRALENGLSLVTYTQQKTIVEEWTTKVEKSAELIKLMINKHLGKDEGHLSTLWSVNKEYKINANGGSEYVERWIHYRQTFKQENQRVAGQLSKIENRTAFAINFGLNTVGAYACSFGVPGSLPTADVDITGLVVTTLGDAEQFSLLCKSTEEAFSERNNDPDE